MPKDTLAYDIRNLLWEHAYPTLRRLDHARLVKLAEQIVQLTNHQGVWTKWGEDREKIAERAADIWIPMEDLREALNGLPGPLLTKVDVEQRILEFRERPYGSGYPHDKIETEALAVYAEEKARGTEFIAILGYMEEWYVGAQERLRQKTDKERREQILEGKRRAEARLRSGS